MIWNKSPEDLERWYRESPKEFRTAFEAAPQDHALAATWSARLAADAPSEKVNGFPFAIGGSLLISLLFWVPYWSTGEVDGEWAAPLIATLALGPLMLYHGLREVWILIGTAAAAAAVACIWWAWEDLPSQWSISSLVEGDEALTAAGERVNFARQTRDLMMIHWPMLLAGLTGWAFVRSRPAEARVDFVRHAVQVAILTGLVLVAGVALLGLTNLLLQSANASGALVEAVNIHLVIWGLSGALLFGHAVWLRHPSALEKILPTLARIFIPLFVLLEAGFLLTHLADGFAALSGDREQLFVYNLLLAAVIALVLLHSAFDEGAAKWTHYLMFALVGLGVIADAVGIAAIASRLGEWGVTPNRLTVLVGNLVFLGTLLGLLWGWIKGSAQPFKATRRALNKALAAFVLWSALVTFAFPAWFGLRLQPSDCSVFTEQIVETEAAIEQDPSAGSSGAEEDME